jgi:hypothetical protein
MKTKSISRISKYLVLGLLILLTACSRLIVSSSSEAYLTTQDANPIYPAAAQTIRSQTPAHSTAAATLVPPEATQAEVQQPAPTSVPTKNGIEASDGKVTEESIGIHLEQGSSVVCTADSTYFVHATITTNGPTTASYEISSTAGQIAAGNFQDMDSHVLSPTVTGTVVFDQADTKNIHLHFVGPYPYPDDITVFLRVNDGELVNAKLSCQE